MKNCHWLPHPWQYPACNIAGAQQQNIPAKLNSGREQTGGNTYKAIEINAIVKIYFTLKVTVTLFWELVAQNDSINN